MSDDPVALLQDLVPFGEPFDHPIVIAKIRPQFGIVLRMVLQHDRPNGLSGHDFLKTVEKLVIRWANSLLVQA